ncbi:MAG TPA: hypothetical protein VGD60_15360 [Candidatus Acidoferrales bacterium]
MFRLLNLGKTAAENSAVRRSRLAKILFAAMFVGAALLVWLSLSSSRAKAADHQPQPLWEIDLAQYGFQGRPPVHLENADTWGNAICPQGVAFIDANVLAVYFIVHEDPPGTIPGARKPLPSDTYRLVAVFLNSNTHELIKKLDWIVPSSERYVSNAFFSPAAKGRFAVGIGDTLSLYSRDFKIVAQYTTPSGELELTASPAGETFLVGETQHIAGVWSRKLNLLDGENLKVLKSWTVVPPVNPKVWGDQLGIQTRQSITIQTADGEPRTVLEHRDSLFLSDFIAKDLLAVIKDDGSNQFMIVSTNGKIVREFGLGLEQPDGPFVAAQDGRRFAVPTMRWGAARHDNPDELHAKVYAIDSAVPLLDLKIVPHHSPSLNFDTLGADTLFGKGGLALSAVGDFLAVKSGEIVQMYAVPASAACAPDCAVANSGAKASPVIPSAPKSYLNVAPSPVAAQALSWLPPDTETVIAENGPFPLPDLRDPDDASDPKQDSSRPSEAEEVIAVFKPIPLSLFGFEKGILGRAFKDQKILLAIEGSRNFLPPAALGLGPFQGCSIAVFDGDVSAQASAFLINFSKAALRTEQIAGQTVTVFQEKWEEDTWTTFVAFPKPNVAVAATNEAYLREVLTRIKNPTRDRAMPAALPEWKYTDTRAAFWAMRHFSRNGKSTDPTSPFAEGSFSVPDQQAVGLTFAFDPATSPTATLVYLSANPDIRATVEQHLFGMQNEPGAREMNVRYRQLAPGIIEGAFDLNHIESAQTFLFDMLGLFGHSIFV